MVEFLPNPRAPLATNYWVLLDCRCSSVHNALLAAGVPSTRYILDGADHGDLGFMGDDKAALPWSAKETMGIMVEFLRRNLGADRAR